MAFAIVKSKDEQDKRNEELAKEEAAGKPGLPTAAQAAGTRLLDVSHRRRRLVYSRTGSRAKAGNVTIDYDNPSPVAARCGRGHLRKCPGQTSRHVRHGDARSDLQPGNYVFYCTVPGHREAGMQGNLTVTGGPKPPRAP